MKLSDWAREQGLHYMTAYGWFKSGKMPVPCYQTASKTIMVESSKIINNLNVVIYARVSSHDKKEDLLRQVTRCEAFCLAKGYSINGVYKEIASGMNDNRKQFWKMIDTNPTTIVVEHKDRLTRFGFEYINRLLLKQNCHIEVINRDAIEETDLIKDMISIITSFCCRLYGARRGQHKAKDIKEIIKSP
jgi:putative resolvase